jgi:hypothetical protein
VSAVVALQRLRVSQRTYPRGNMASSGKRKTTMAKLNRERKLIEKRHAKQIKKDARKLAAAEGETEPLDGMPADDEVTAEHVTDDEATADVAASDAVTADEPLAR